MFSRSGNVGVSVSQCVGRTVAHFQRRVRADAFRNATQKVSNRMRVRLGTDAMQQDKSGFFVLTITHELAGPNSEENLRAKGLRANPPQAVIKGAL